MNKALGWIVAAIVIIVVVLGAMAYFRPEQAPNLDSDSTKLEYDDADLGGGNFVQEEPSSLPTTPTSPAVTPGATSSTSPSPAAASGTTITLTDTGFSPATVTVPVNTTVTFVNNGQAAHWPASNPHPSLFAVGFFCGFMLSWIISSANSGKRV